MTEQERLESINRYGGHHIKKFKDDCITYKICLAAVKRTGSAIRDIPERFLNEELYTAACKCDGYALSYVPEECKTKKMCLYAVISEPRAYKYVPVDFITPEFIINAAKKCRYDSSRFFPKEIRNIDFYSELVTFDPKGILYIPKKDLTAKNCKILVEKMGYPSLAETIKDIPELLGRIPTSLYSHEICLNFIKSKFFKKAMKEHNLEKEKDIFSDKVIKKYPSDDWFCFYENESIKYSLPSLMQWEDVAKKLLEIDGSYIEYVSDDILTEELCYFALNSAPKSLDDIPVRMRTKEMYLYAFSLDEHNIKDIPEEFITQEMCEIAVDKYVYIIKIIPEKFVTEEMLLSVAKRDCSYVKYNFPERLRTKEFIQKLIETNPDIKKDMKRFQ